MNYINLELEGTLKYLLIYTEAYILILTLSFLIMFSKYFILDFGERVREGEREDKKHQCERECEKHQLAAFHVHPKVPNPQPRHVPQLVIKLVTLWFARGYPTN